jgi:lipopolysaccharide export system protein LptA
VKFSEKPNHRSYNTPTVRPLLILIFCSPFFITTIGWGQNRPVKKKLGERPQLESIDRSAPATRPTPTTPSTTPANDTPSNKSDTTKTAPPKKGDIETTINYTARDSINTSVDGQIVWLYGDAKIVYGSIELEANEIEIDYKNNTLRATGTRDSLGQRVGFPVFKNGEEVYETRDITYNFKTGRARISEVVTQQGEGYLHGDVVFKNEKSELLSLRNSYTTCSLEEPHFRIRSTKTKAIPDDKIVSGPFYMEFNEIPLPLGFLFGMFPAQRESKSGIIMPSYGEENRRGFNLRDGGYYFDINEYFKLALTGDIYSKGGYAIKVRAPYIKRYKYNGNLNFNYSYTKVNQYIEDKSEQKDYNLTWIHQPQSKGTGRFSASVNAATQTFTRNNFINPNFLNPNSSSLSNISTKLSSNISYNKRFANTPFSMGLNLKHDQDLQTNQIDLQLPNLTVNMQNQYPFQRKDGKTTVLDNFQFGYSMAASNRTTNNIGRVVGSTPARDSIAPFNLNNFARFFENGRKGIRHSIPIGYSFKAFRYFTVSPSINYEEKWYFEKLNWEYDIVNNRPTLVASDTIKEFNRIANYSFSTGLNTRLYGTYFFNRGNVKAIRHIVNPNVSFSYTPDFTKNDNYFQAINDNGKIIYKSRHESFVYGSSNTGRSGAIGFGVGNSVEMKVKSAKDTVARKISLLNSLSISSSYNLMADSFNLAPFSISANNSILDNLLNLSLSASLDPYYYKTFTDEEGKRFKRRVDEYAWKAGSLGRITSATLAVNTNLNPKARKNEQSSREKIIGSDLPEQEKNFLLNDPSAYIDFEIPWSLRVNYNLNYAHPINQPVKITQTLQFSGDLSLSEKWKITFNSGYHFETEKFTQTTITVARDLHCWTMNLNWIPFGYYTQYYFTIRVKASVLQDLKMERRKPFFDNL